MYVFYRSRDGKKIPIRRVYTGGKAKKITKEHCWDAAHEAGQSVKAQFMARFAKQADAKELNEDSIDQEQQNSEEVTPKDKPNACVNQLFQQDSDLKSNTQKEGSISSEGWIPLFRKSMRSQVFQNEGLWKLWTWCLMKASHTEQWVAIKTGRGTTEVYLLPGQFIFGRKTAAKELNMKPSTVMKRMLKLENMQNLNIQSNTHYSIVTLTNWGFYRELMKKVTGKGTTKEQPRNTYNNDKNEKNKDIYSEATKVPHRTNSLLPIAKRIIDYLNKLGNRNFTYSNANTSIIQARLKEGHTEEACKRVMEIKWNDPDFDKKYFRPSTLFRPTKFEGYLNEQPAKRWDHAG